MLTVPNIKYFSCFFHIFDSKLLKVSCACKPHDSTHDPCSYRTRRRSQKCINKKVDDTICPCVETEKCNVPTCPIETGKKYLPPMCKTGTFPTAQQITDQKIIFSVTQCQHGPGDYKDRVNTHNL